MTQDELKEKLHYDQETGLFTWLESPVSNIPAGRVAGAKVKAGGGKEYVQIGIAGRKYYAHRLAWLYVTGELPVMKVCHINGDTSDNRWANLMQMNAFENQHSRRPVSLGNNTYPGVNERGGRFSAGIRIRGQRKHLGTFPTAELAYAAYLDARRAAIV